MRTKVEWRSSSRDNYISFCKKYPTIKITCDEWKNILYTFNDAFREYILETGDKARLPNGMGEISITKKKRKRYKENPEGRQFINLPIDWIKTREKHKLIYNFNYHTEGFFFGWVWFHKSAILKQSLLWRFKPTRSTSRLLAHYIKTDEKYQHLYKEWNIKNRAR
jgi:hypothetical protein